MDEHEDKMSLHALHNRLKPLEKFYDKYHETFYKVGFWGFVIRYIFKGLM